MSKTIEHLELLNFFVGIVQILSLEFQKFRISKILYFPPCVSLWVQFYFLSAGTDISKPLKNSLIHTGHGDPGGKSWGSPEVIDE